MTPVFVPHQMAFSRDTATRMVFIDRGEVVETATPSQFFSASATIRARQFLQRYVTATPLALS
jgi:polar amino acid transport system ATP-binding protein